MGEGMSTAEANNRAVAADRIAAKVEESTRALMALLPIASVEWGVEAFPTPTEKDVYLVCLSLATAGPDEWWSKMNGGKLPSERTAGMVLELLRGRALRASDDDPFSGLPK